MRHHVVLPSVRRRNASQISPLSKLFRTQERTQSADESMLSISSVSENVTMRLVSPYFGRTVFTLDKLFLK